MATVTGPLFSISASGKIADAMVHFSWKNRAVVRRWLKPSNPQTGAQGDRRIMLGGLGRACASADTTSTFAVFAREVAAAGQTWLSALVKFMMDTYFPTVAAYDAVYDEYLAHGQIADFASEAAGLGMKSFNLDYKAMDHGFVLGFQLYCLGKYGTQKYILDNNDFNAAPYTKVIANWVLADIQLMVADFAAV